MHRLRATPFAITLLALGPAVAPAAAQVRASERATVSQTVDGTVITLDYSRPVARGRDLFGGIVAWDRSWTPGANWATTFEVNRDVTLNGQPVSAGVYSMWMIPRQGDWTVFLSSRSRVFHTQKQQVEDAAVRFDVKPEPGPHMEALAFYFPEVRRDGASLRMHWGETVVPMDIAVRPTRPAVVAEDAAARYTGRYRGSFTGDSTAKESVVEVVFDNGRLSLRFEDMPAGFEYALAPAGKDRFLPVIYENGQLVETDQESEVVFIMENGRAIAFEMRFQDEVYGRGRRVQ